MVNEQRAVVAMSARTDLELAASAEEAQLNCRNVPFHVDPQAAFWSREGGVSLQPPPACDTIPQWSGLERRERYHSAAAQISVWGLDM